jgi:hypothetical protein
VTLKQKQHDLKSCSYLLSQRDQFLRFLDYSVIDYELHTKKAKHELSSKSAANETRWGWGGGIFIQKQHLIIVAEQIIQNSV